MGGFPDVGDKLKNNRIVLNAGMSYFAISLDVQNMWALLSDSYSAVFNTKEFKKHRISKKKT